MRFMWFALGLVVAMLVLVAGAFDDLPLWWREPPPVLARMPTAGPTAAPASVAAPMVTNEDHDQPRAQARDAREARDMREARDLQEQIAQERRDLVQARTAVAAASQDLAALRHQREQATEPAAAVGQANVANRSVAMVAAPEQSVQPANGPAAVSSTPMVTLTTAAQTSPVAHADPVTDLNGGAHADAGVSAVTSQQRLLATRRLVAARAALVEGKQARARWLLSLARTQLERWPTPPGAEQTAAVDQPESQVETAITLIKRDDRDGAVRAIDQVLVAVTGSGRTPPHPFGQANPDSTSG